MDNSAINKGRIVYYALFSSLFAFDLNLDNFETAVRALDLLSKNPIDEQSEKAFSNMQRRLLKGGFSALKKENDRVFCDPTTTFVPMTASFYHEQCDNGNKRIEMIDYLLQSRFRRNDDVFKEHEDHIEFIMSFIRQLIEQELEGDESCRELALKVFGNVLNNMVDSFGDRLFRHEKSFFYKQAVLAFRSFIEFERMYLNLGKPEGSDQTGRERTVLEKERDMSRECIKLSSNECV